MRVLATPEAVTFVREGGGRVFVWTLPMDVPSGGASLFALEASTESPGVEHNFQRLSGPDFDVLIDTGNRALPDELHFAVKGWRRKLIRAYWNGHSYGRDQASRNP
jgi:hypothetical protein